MVQELVHLGEIVELEVVILEHSQGLWPWDYVSALKHATLTLLLYIQPNHPSRPIQDQSVTTSQQCTYEKSPFVHTFIHPPRFQQHLSRPFLRRIRPPLLLFLLLKLRQLRCEPIWMAIHVKKGHTSRREDEQMCRFDPMFRSYCRSFPLFTLSSIKWVVSHLDFADKLQSLRYIGIDPNLQTFVLGISKDPFSSLIFGFTASGIVCGGR